MGKIASSIIAAAALLLAFAAPAHAEESLRGFYEGNLANNTGKVVFFVSGNNVISAYAFNTEQQQAFFGSGSLNPDGTFSLTANGIAVTGTVTPDRVTASYLSNTITADRIDLFGNTANIAGRFNGIAHSASGKTITDARFLIDSDGKIFFIGRLGDQVIGGFGNLTVSERKRHHDGEGDGDDDAANKGDDDHGNGDIDNDDNGDHDSDRDEHQDGSTKFFSGTFTITLTNGVTITGTIDFSRETIFATFTINGEEFTFNGDRDAFFNRLANISTRGFVNTGQGQLIGGFIITGGPKMVMIRALGQSLASQGVSPVLANPRLQLFQNNQLIKENDDWGSNSNADDMSKASLAPTNAQESALLIRLEPGAYTTVVSGVNNSTGIALVEVYEIDRD